MRLLKDAFEIVDVDATGLECGILHEAVLEFDSGLDGSDAELTKCACCAIDGFFACVGVDDEFTDHGVVIWRDVVAWDNVGVDADARASGELPGVDAPCGGHEVFGGVFGVDTALDGVAPDGDVFLLEGECGTGGDEDRHFDDIDAGDKFGNGMLDLDAGVDFEHVEVLLRVHEELDGCGTGVFGTADETCGGFADGEDFFTIDAGPWCFFDDLLVSALHGAIAFEEMNSVAFFVAEDLDFDMASGFEELFDED